MADIVIRNWKIWESCDDCPIAFDCELNQHIDGYKMLNGRPNKCPIIILPNKHGDLMDKSKIMDMIYGKSTDARYQIEQLYYTPIYFTSIIDKIPIVLSAEK